MAIDPSLVNIINVSQLNDATSLNTSNVVVVGQGDFARKITLGSFSDYIGITQLQNDINALQNDVDDLGLITAVSYTPQVLTSEQQEQVRENIGVGTPTRIGVNGSNFTLGDINFVGSGISKTGNTITVSTGGNNDFLYQTVDTNGTTVGIANEMSAYINFMGNDLTGVVISNPNNNGVILELFRNTSGTGTMNISMNVLRANGTNTTSYPLEKGCVARFVFSQYDDKWIELSVTEVII